MLKIFRQRLDRSHPLRADGLECPPRLPSIYLGCYTPKGRPPNYFSVITSAYKFRCIRAGYLSSKNSLEESDVVF